MGAAAIEIWTMDEGIYFDNVVVASDPAEAEKLRHNVWEPKQAIEVRRLPAPAFRLFGAWCSVE